jgi:hypothetical protein
VESVDATQSTSASASFRAGLLPMICSNSRSARRDSFDW